MTFPRGLLVVVAVAFLAHAGTLANGFVYDDRPAIVWNPVVQAPLDPEALVTTDYWGKPPGKAGTWRPLVVLSFWADRRIGGGAPWAFHLSNLLFHAGAAVALALALNARARRPRLALLGGVTFAALAVNTEAVAGIVGRADVLAAGFLFLAWWAAERPAAAAAAFFAALLCKESALAFPLAIFLCDRLLAPPGERPPRPWAPRYLALAGAAVAYVALRTLLFAGFGEVSRTDNNNPLVDEAFPVRLWTGLRLFLLSLRLVLVPLNLSADYSFAEVLPEESPLSAEVLLGAAALAAVAAGAWVFRRRAPLAAAAAVLFVVPWFAVSNIAMPLPTILAERLLYLPAAGAALALALALDAAWAGRGRAAAAALVAVVVGGNLALGAARDRDWKDDLALFSSAAESSPRSARAWNNYGAALYRAGRREEALYALDRALQIAPLMASAHALAGAVLDELGRPAAAEAHLRRAFQLAPDEPKAAYNLGLFLARHGRKADAAAVLRDYVARHPERVKEAELLRRIEADVAR